MESGAAHHTHQSSGPSAEPAAALIGLTYELLDAHADTARLTCEGASDDEWRQHLDYLRDLQRVGREALAQADTTRC